jgi:hypothetical protein
VITADLVATALGVPRFDPAAGALIYRAEDGGVRRIQLADGNLPAPAQAAEILAKVRSGGLDPGRMHPIYAIPVADRPAGELVLERASITTTH